MVVREGKNGEGGEGNGMKMEKKSEKTQNDRIKSTQQA